MKTKFTKGEWYFDEDAIYTKEKIEANIICESPFKGFESYRNWEANAKLMIAAPRLLQACKSVITAYKDIDDMLDEPMKSVIEECKQAVKKATE